MPGGKDVSDGSILPISLFSPAEPCQEVEATPSCLWNLRKQATYLKDLDLVNGGLTVPSTSTQRSIKSGSFGSVWGNSFPCPLMYFLSIVNSQGFSSTSRRLQSNCPTSHVNASTLTYILYAMRRSDSISPLICEKRRKSVKRSGVRKRVRCYGAFSPTSRRIQPTSNVITPKSRKQSNANSPSSCTKPRDCRNALSMGGVAARVWLRLVV